ncbi:translation initiation factor SUI1 [Insectomime virus]|nr:translation initiation factor SUI1 [Insectomime virus]
MLAGYICSEQELDQEKSSQVHISLVRVTKKAFVTRISGLEHEPEKVVKALKKHLCCNGKYNADGTFQFQGDQRQKITTFLNERLFVPKESIFVHGA